MIEKSYSILSPFFNETSPTHSPNEVLAVGAEGRLAQVGGHELVADHLVDLPAHGAAPLPRLERARLLLEHGVVGVRLWKYLFVHSSFTSCRLPGVPVGSR